MRILVVEDDRKTAAFVGKALKAEGFAVDVLRNGDDALTAIGHTAFDAVVLDIMLPGRDGLSLLRQLRAQGKRTPVLLLSARGEVNERVEGLNAGADDYLAKPFALEELIARVHALVRRADDTKSALLQVADLSLDTTTRTARRGDRAIELTTREYRLLELLMRAPGRICGRMLIIEKVWDYSFDPGSNIVDVYVRRLRGKIDDGFETKLLHSVRGVGYVMKEPGMTLRQRLALHYGAVVVVALLLLGGLTYHEFATERRLRALLPPGQQHEAEWGEEAEVFVYAMIPVILIGGWWLTRRSLFPLSQLARSVERVRVENLRESLPRTGNGDEVDRLTEAFNAMATRLDESFQQVRGFTLHASHELKTPLTVMRGELETAMRHEESYTPQQRECLHSLLDEVQRLTQIVDALTLLSKADAGQVNLERQPVRLAELVRESYEDALILAESQQVQVTLSECADLVVLGDRHRLRQLLLNLVDNAVKYNRPAGTVTLVLRKAGPAAEIEIISTGAGIPPDLQPRVFDRFVRGDEARVKAIEGCGLGLSIAQWIALAHGGSIQISSEPGSTTTALVRLPLAA